jgi:cell wall-associated NlpC family hydrolase
MHRNHPLKWAALPFLAILLVSCSSLPTPSSNQHTASAPSRDKGREVVMFAMALMDSDYHFGGSNPESGFDCSGMVSYIFQRAIGLKLPHSAAQMAKQGREVSLSKLSPGDLVFFNTRGWPFSHVGIYVGDSRFIHAPGQDGKIKISNLKSVYYQKRLEAARTFLNSYPDSDRGSSFSVGSLTMRLRKS